MDRTRLLDQTNLIWKDLEKHGLRILCDTRGVPGQDRFLIVRLAEPGTRDMSVQLTFTPEGIVIQGDFTPGNSNGVCSKAGYGARWFSDDLSVDYLAEKFLQKQWTKEAASDWLQWRIDDLEEELSECLADTAVAEESHGLSPNQILEQAAADPDFGPEFGQGDDLDSDEHGLNGVIKRKIRDLKNLQTEDETLDSPSRFYDATGMLGIEIDEGPWDYSEKEASALWAIQLTFQRLWRAQMLNTPPKESDVAPE